MHIYFCGIGGVAIGPLAEIAHDAGYTVSGSDLQPNEMTEQLRRRGIQVIIGQDGSQIAQLHNRQPINWLVASSAIPQDHPEVTFAKRHAIRVSKRDEALNHIVAEQGQKIVAVAGTHGKTTTTAMLVWLFKELRRPASYSIGTTVSFGPSGHFDKKAEYFLYEADEYDRNMLHFKPAVSLITSLDYDHPDTYPTVAVYKQAFKDFINQSQSVYMWQRDHDYLALDDTITIRLADELNLPSPITLPGEHMRRNATLACQCFAELFQTSLDTLIEIINRFPGTGRRFEKIGENLYSSYAHHPTEIAADIAMARELTNEVVVVYQPHQNVRQQQIKDLYKNCFDGAEKVYWLPTYLTREDPQLKLLSPNDLIANLSDPSLAQVASMDAALVQTINQARQHGALVLVMGAGSIDTWARKSLQATT